MATSKKKVKEVKANKPVKGKMAGTRWPVALVCAALIAIVTYWVFSPSLQNEFTNWDDPVYINENPLVANNTLPVKEIFSIKNPVSLNYHPLTILTLAWNYQSGKLNPGGYHLENVILHVLNTLLVFFFIYFLTQQNLLMASFVALFFGIHPMHVESVSWVSERKDVLYVFFFMAGLITYLYYRNTKKITWYALTILLFILSCLSKGIAVVFPVVLVLIDYLLDVKWQPKSLLNKIPLLVISLGFGVLAFKIQQGGAIAESGSFTFLQSLCFAGYGAIMYIVKLFVPIHLSAFYPYPSWHPLPAVFYFTAILFLLIVAVLFIFFRREKPIMFGFGFYFVTVALVLQFISVGSSIISERYSYLSYIGLLFILAYFLNKAWTPGSKILNGLKYPLTTLVVFAAVIFSYLTYTRTQVWKNSETLWTDVVSQYPESSLAHFQLGIAFEANKNYDEALMHLNKAIALNTNYAEAYRSRGDLFNAQGQYQLALNDYNNSILIDSVNKYVYQNRALVFVKLKEYPKAENDFAKAISLSRDAGSIYWNRGIYFIETNQPEKALSDFDKCINLKSTNDSIYNWQGVAYHQLKQYNNAINCFSKAIQINPQAAQYWLNKSFSENADGQKEAAKNDAIKAEQLGLAVDLNYLKYLGAQ